MVLVRGFGFSASLHGDAEIFLLVCGEGSESINEKYSTADWPAVIF